MRHAARWRVGRALAAGKLDAMYFLMAASEEPLRSFRPSRAALISSEYFGPSAVFFFAGGIVICAQSAGAYHERASWKWTEKQTKRCGAQRGGGWPRCN